MSRLPQRERAKAPRKPRPHPIKAVTGTIGQPVELVVLGKLGQLAWRSKLELALIPTSTVIKVTLISSSRQTS